MQSVIWIIALIVASVLASPVSAEESSVEEILVTGSHIKRKNQLDSISPMSTIARQDIDTTGILTGQELFRWFPANSASENQIDILTASASAGTANVNLRGLGLGSTLVLLNGRRQTVSSAAAQQGDTFVDLNSLVPMILVDRVEVLKDGAAATYGSDAVAGVVNYLTRDTFTGLEVRGDYQATTRSDDQADSEISMIWGGELEGSSLVFAFSHFDRERLQLLERDDLPRMTESSFGAPGSLFLLEPSATIPDAVVGVFNADPECGRATGSRLVTQANGQTQCFYDFGSAHTLVPDETRNSAYAILDKSFNEHLSLRGELGWAKNETRFNFSSSLPMLNLPTVSGDHPGNPWAADGLLRFRAYGDGDGALGSGATPVFADHETTRAVLAASGQIYDSSWRYDAAYTYSRNELVDSQPDQSESRLRRALAGFGGADCDPLDASPGTGDCLYFNPFGTSLDAQPGDPEYNTAEVIRYINSENIRRERTELNVTELTFAGTIVPLPAGNLDVAVGYQHREELRNRNMSDDANNADLVFLVGDPDFNVDRAADAYFAEVVAPILDNDFGALETQLAVRYEDYDTGFDSVDPKIGLHYRSAGDAFGARFTYGTSFRAPTLFQQYVTSTALLGNFDPFTGTVGFAAQTAVGSEDLKPEESENYNFGITVRPLDDLQIDVDFWDIEYTDRIVQENGQSLITAEAQALLAAGCTPATLTDPLCANLRNPQIVRDPLTGSPARVFVQRFNAASLEANGVDVRVAYSWSTAIGAFSVTNETSYVNKFDLVPVKGAPTIEGAKWLRSFEQLDSENKV